MIISCTYIKTLYRDFNTGFTKFYLKPDDYKISLGTNILGYGFIPKYTERMKLLLTGELIENNNIFYFKIEQSETNLRTESDFIHFLECLSNIGIKKKKLIQLGEKYGEKLIENSADENFLEEIEKEFKIEKTKIRNILFNISQSLIIEKIKNKFHQYGITYKQAAMIFDKFGNNAINNIIQDPYILSHLNICFGICDSIAKDNHIRFYDKKRIKSLIDLSLSNSIHYGDCYFTYDKIKGIIRNIENKQSAYTDIIPEALLMRELFSSDKCIIKKEEDEIRFFSKAVYFTETEIAKELKRLNDSSTEYYSDKELKDYIDSITDIVLDETQKNAISILKDKKTTCIIGGPGTGKTTIIKKIVKGILEKDPDANVSICAPSGRAAERIFESTGYRATTIHKLLEFENFNGQENVAVRNKENKLESDFVIIDEMSMVGIFLFAKLLQALEDNTKLILVGDTNQLESIEPGAVLRDIIESGYIQVFKLDTIHRQTGKNLIISNSKKIAEQHTNLETDDSFEIIHFKNDKEMLTYCYEYGLKAYDPNNIHSFHIITPMKKGYIGTNNINKGIQSLFHDPSESHYIYGDDLYFMGDKVMTVRNNYDEQNNYFNGDLGIVETWDNQGIGININDIPIYINFDNMEDVTLAYAMTVHKCQGSEGEEIMIILSDSISPVMLKNSIIYTAVTRAKKKVKILYTGNALETAIKNKEIPRRTSLKAKIKENFGS